MENLKRNVWSEKKTCGVFRLPRCPDPGVSGHDKHHGKILSKPHEQTTEAITFQLPWE